MAKGSKNSGNPKKSVVTTDERFSAIHNDPRFRLPKRDDIKVELDDRFKKSDLEAIKRKAKIDKYGRKIKEKDNNEPFNKYYKTKDDKKSKNDGSDSEESGSDDEEDEEDEDESKSDEESEENNSSADETADAVAKVDLARGEGLPSDAESSSDESSSDEESSEEEEEEDDDDEKPEEGEPSKRFAVVNLDWDHVKSVDLMATFQSFVPASGHIDNVSIFPSEFGKERMQKEDMEGPPKELFQKKSKKSQPESDEEDEESDSDSELEAKDLYEEGNGETDYDHKSLRRYQLQRLRYYYAVVTCDSVQTAKNIYDNCDGTEYESTANLFDLRYIPEEMEFDDEPRDSCNKIPTNYKPQTFVTDALQHSKVKLTWDETPAERVKLSSKAFSQRELDDMDFKAYLASDNSDEEESDHEDLKNKYKNLVGQSTKIGNKDIFNQNDDDEDDVDMEITFTPGLDEKAANGGENNGPAEGQEESSIDKLKRKAKERRKARKDKIKELKKEAEDQKRSDKPNKDKKSKKKQNRDEDDDEKKAELELLMLDENNKKQQDHFDLKELMRSEKEKSKKSKHRNKDKIIEDDFKPDLNDPRFKEIFTSHEFAIDPSQPQFKKTATMAKILEERNKRRDDGETASSSSKKSSKDTNSKKRKTPSSENDDVNSLVQRIKRKSKK
ncbi:Pre-rRNA-processing protein [Wickerhamomyces ciferrii]|uniref:Pre-rRNA-processing protein n=1 Tax=Wickerhamomyces ciferrii (strain ATCC 14091 / BCRC 22168 / CBS 111 / JCM 3599 / NBRC 0793 / NRRL Y-1031 F-60-10) TaxID=1206466 RepID=K0KRB2_WICCF|nr:Pre-rRNA-processing protein [Wickerhamomyces ciferrii]CCH43799.1 Pre-rRNA-processing protein [Wickerhamomyces ciferrii]